MKLSEWARKQNISYRTAWRWFHEGRLPVKAEQVGALARRVELAGEREEDISTEGSRDVERG